MSYVDLMGKERWTRADHAARSDLSVRSSVPHDREHVMIRRTLAVLFDATLPQDHPLRAVLFPNGAPALKPVQLAELAAAAAVFLQADNEAEDGLTDGALLNAALDIEDAAQRLASIPPPPEDSQAEDPYASARAEAMAVHQDLLTAATPQVLALLDQRAAANTPVPAGTP